MGFYLLLGILLAVAFYFTWMKSRKSGLSIGAWVLALLTILLGAFTLSWVYASILEGETQAAGMGVLIFGGITVLLFLGFNKVANQKNHLAKPKDPTLQG